MNTKDAQKLSAVIQQSRLSKDEIARIRAVCDQKADDDELRKLRADGHSVTFLQKDGLFEKAEPELLAKLTNIMKETDEEHWSLIANEVKEDVNVRVIEYHHYIRGGGLLNKFHFDGGSILTMVCMLSDPTKDFEGGQLMIWECDEEFKKYTVNQGDVLIFP